MDEKKSTEDKGKANGVKEMDDENDILPKPQQPLIKVETNADKERLEHQNRLRSISGDGDNNKDGGDNWRLVESLLVMTSRGR